MPLGAQSIVVADSRSAYKSRISVPAAFDLPLTSLRLEITRDPELSRVKDESKASPKTRQASSYKHQKTAPNLPDPKTLNVRR